MAPQFAVRAALHRRPRDARRRLGALGHSDRRPRPQHRDRRRDRPLVEARRRARGWGGPELLQSYEDERRQIGVRNVRASGNATAERRERREETYALDPRGQRTRPRGARNASGSWPCSRRGTTTIITGIERGYRYTNSALLWPEPGEGPDPDNSSTCRRVGPARGCRTCGATTADALLDRLGPWYTVLRFGERVDTRGIEAALLRRACRTKRSRSTPTNPPTRSTAASTRFSSGPTCTSPGAGRSRP